MNVGGTLWAWTHWEVVKYYITLHTSCCIAAAGVNAGPVNYSLAIYMTYISFHFDTHFENSMCSKHGMISRCNFIQKHDTALVSKQRVCLACYFIIKSLRFVEILKWGNNHTHVHKIVFIGWPKLQLYEVKGDEFTASGVPCDATSDWSVTDAIKATSGCYRLSIIGRHVLCAGLFIEN